LKLVDPKFATKIFIALAPRFLLSSLIRPAFAQNAPCAENITFKRFTKRLKLSLQRCKIVRAVLSTAFVFLTTRTFSSVRFNSSGERFDHALGRTRDDVRGNQFADRLRGRGAGVDRGANASDVAANNGRNETAADLNAFDHFNVGGFRHRVGRVDEGENAFRFNQSNSVVHFYFLRI
jgi:hypothetical protein